jgi:hypothetical protein
MNGFEDAMVLARIALDPKAYAERLASLKAREEAALDREIAAAEAEKAAQQRIADREAELDRFSKRLNSEAAILYAHKVDTDAKYKIVQASWNDIRHVVLDPAQPDPHYGPQAEHGRGEPDTSFDGTEPAPDRVAGSNLTRNRRSRAAERREALQQ